MAKKLWGGRFNKKTDSLVEEFTSSIKVDKRLAEYDVIGSIIHAAVLKEAKLISAQEYGKINRGLKEILQNIRLGRFRADLLSEDIHSDIQSKLEKRVGSAALKLHTARSRNDQILFDLKLYCLSACNEIAALIDKLSFSELLKNNSRVRLPGYTHLQHAQPIASMDYFLAYDHMLSRDKGRIIDARNRLNISLGSGALAGTNISKDNYIRAIKNISKNIGLGLGGGISVPMNSLDSVSDRDFVIEILNVLAIIGMHLSRLSEDLIIWSSAEFGFIELDDSFCTGSSLMPQKKNPDVLELIRGNTGKLYGNLISVLVMMKGLPLAYNRDMQLDKEPLFSSFKIVKDELIILSKLMPTVKFNNSNIVKQLQDESLYATDIAHYLVEKGVVFKEAHKIIGNLVKFSLNNNIKIREMPNKQLQKFSKFLDQAVINRLMDPGYSIASKKSLRRSR